MPGRALIERRPWLLASIVAAATFIWLQRSQLPGVHLLILQTAPMLLLAVYALLRHRGQDTRILAIMILLQGIGSAISSIFEGISAILMTIGFAFGIWLFLMHRRTRPSFSQRALAVAVLFLTPPICQLATNPDAHAGWAPAWYGVALGGMAGSAWMSSFPRYRVGAGAMIIVAASVLALMSLRVVNGPGLGEVVGWALLYFGNLLMATGVTGELRARG